MFQKQLLIVNTQQVDSYFVLDKRGMALLFVLLSIEIGAGSMKSLIICMNLMMSQRKENG